MSQTTIKNVSDISEARLLIPKILNSTPFLQSIGYAFLFAAFIFICLSFIRKKSLGFYAAVIFILTFSFLLPFHPDRRPEAPKINEMLLSKGVDTLYMYNADYLKKPLVFYGYPKYNIIDLDSESARKIQKTETLGLSKSYCIFKEEAAANSDIFSCELYY